ncbi:hypothetical protein DMB66_27710 [Actinoplanes sp. ATCC 53533]|uniref:hypothetical protein n=1 Tax=Actinoplanes sp. ATCC 53533 TaxID=1288362 RepID=UPI000F7696CD|nr:hypothetical protein [Actinoplanes sp. ATCC 53533]RSM59474.1 hypothetical protein DMB66_27710 [Actinoplanes sp. ATCC 53533]
MKLRTFFARFLADDTTQTRPNTAADSSTGTRRADSVEHIDRRNAWRPTARSAYGRYIQASEHRQAAIEAISQRGRERGIDAKDIIAAHNRLDTELRARGWHPDQFDHGFDDEAPINDFMDRTDVDYDPRMAAYDARTAQRRDTDGDYA